MATLFIADTYRTFYQTSDEPAHIACGLNWLHDRNYTLEQLHPPLARVAEAILPYLYGVPYIHNPDAFRVGHDALYDSKSYWTALTLARIGVLPFFWLTCFAVWKWMNGVFSPAHAWLAVLFTAFCPTVLANSSVATTDAPLMAMFLCSLLALWNFLLKPTWASAAISGGVVGLACLTKFTEMPFLLLSAALVCGGIWFLRRVRTPPILLVCLSAVACFVTVWAGYFFSLGPILIQGKFSSNGGRVSSHLSSWERAVLSFNFIPAPEFFRGIAQAAGNGVVGRQSFLLDQFYTGGKWDFFPVALLAKTPIPFLILALAGLVFCLIPRSTVPREKYLLMAGVAGPLIVGMTGKMNIGLRHVLPLYPFLAMLASVGAVSLWRRPMGRVAARAVRVALVVLVSWTAIACAHAAPDFIPYFNEVAAPDKDRLLIDSDLDWGQDIRRLVLELQADHVQEVWLACSGTDDLDRSGFPTWHLLLPGSKPRGWIAISEDTFERRRDEFQWLSGTPYKRVGQSIRLYNLSGAS